MTACGPSWTPDPTSSTTTSRPSAASRSRSASAPAGIAACTSCGRAKEMAREIGYPVHTKSQPDGRPGRDARRADRGVRGAARGRRRHPDHRPIPPAVDPAPAARALLPSRRVRRDEGRGARARLPARRVGAAGPLELSRPRPGARRRAQAAAPPGDDRRRGPDRPARGLTRQPASGRSCRPGDPVSIDFDPVPLRPRRRRVDPIAVGVVVVALALGVAVVKPWESRQAARRRARPSPSSLAPRRARPCRPRQRRPRRARAGGRAGVPAATWAEVAPVVKPHDPVGRPGDRRRPAPQVGSAASADASSSAGRPRRSTASTIEIARWRATPRRSSALGTHVPVRDRGRWTCGSGGSTNEQRPSGSTPARSSRRDRDGSFLFVRSGPTGSARSWEAGHYRVDVLAAGRLHRIAVQIPGRFGCVPRPR